MATYAENLVTTRNQIAATLAEITLNPKPSYSVANQSVSWNEYRSSLMADLEKLNALIQQSGSPFCIVSKMRA